MFVWRGGGNRNCRIDVSTFRFSLPQENLYSSLIQRYYLGQKNRLEHRKEGKLGHRKEGKLGHRKKGRLNIEKREVKHRKKEVRI